MTDIRILRKLGADRVRIRFGSQHLLKLILRHQQSTTPHAEKGVSNGLQEELEEE
jgi:hypothetical protein